MGRRGCADNVAATKINEEIVNRSRMRYTAGGCLVAIGELAGLGTGVVALADTGTSNDGRKHHSEPRVQNPLGGMGGLDVDHGPNGNDSDRDGRHCHNSCAPGTPMGTPGAALGTPATALGTPTLITGTVGATGNSMCPATSVTGPAVTCHSSRKHRCSLNHHSCRACSGPT
jgi:hypothetical protein